MLASISCATSEELTGDKQSIVGLLCDPEHIRKTPLQTTDPFNTTDISFESLFAVTFSIPQLIALQEELTLASGYAAFMYCRKRG